MLWTARQSGALTVLMGALLVYLAVLYARNGAYVSEPQPGEGVRAGELSGRIDPNTADAAALAAVPTLGPALARRIVEARDAFLRENPGQAPYARPDDLLRVRGIGPATVANIEPYLAFPATRPSP